MSQKKLTIQIPEAAVPSLVLSTSTSTVTTASDSSFPATPKDQIIMTEEERENEAKTFVGSLDMEWGDLDLDSQNRVKRIMSSDFSWSPTKYDKGQGNRFETTFRKQFLEFAKTLGHCQNVDEDALRLEVLGVFFDLRAMDSYLVIRRQKSGICCLHAGVVLQHYLNVLRAGVDDHTMMDICGFMRNDLDGLKKKQYIQKGTCGLGSEDFFRQIIGLPKHEFRRVSPYLKSKDPDAHDYDVDYLFRNLVKDNRLQEPALVSCFRIEGNFHKQNVFDYEVAENTLLEYAQSKGKKEGEYVEHSMVCVGAFKDSASKAWFLLQNFWKGGFFKLVSSEYLASCRPTLGWVARNDSVALVDSFSTVDAPYAETTVHLEECASEQISHEIEEGS